MTRWFCYLLSAILLCTDSGIQYICNKSNRNNHRLSCAEFHLLSSFSRSSSPLAVVSTRGAFRRQKLHSRQVAELFARISCSTLLLAATPLPLMFIFGSSGEHSIPGIMEEIIVNEEYTGDDFEDDLNNLSLTPDITRKCGEVFLGQRGTFTFVCSQCLQRFSDLQCFGEHVRDIHPLPQAETLVSVTIEDEVSLLTSELSDENETGHEMEYFVIEEDDLHTTKTLNNPPVSEHCEAVDQSDDSSDHEPKPLKKRQSSKRKQKSYCCFSCGRIFTAFLKYFKHYRVEHSEMIENNELITNESCNESAFVPKVPDEMVCKYCLKVFVEPAAYHTHMENGHPKKLYSCIHCTMTFRNRNSRDYHIDAHEGNRRFQCPHCPKAFSHPNNLRNHVHIHLNIKPYSCQYCGQKYVQHSALKIHERIHTRERPYQCDECGMSFIAQIKLTNHMRRHKNIKNYKCPHCEKAFFSSSTLNGHILTHTRETPFSCDICNQKFRAKAALRSHKLLHSDEKKYECQVCGKTFAQRPGLYSHMKSHGAIK